MKIFLIYFFLFTFWVENSLGFKLTDIPGLSLFNLSVYLLILAWAYTIVFKVRVLRWNEINFYLVILICMAIFSIPYNHLIEDLPNTYLKYELIALKVWVNPFLVFFILFNIIEDERTCKLSILGLIILLFITSLSTPLISLKVIDIGGANFAFYQGRAAAFSEPNQYAGYLVLFIPLLMTFVLFNKSLIIKGSSAFVLLTAFIALITTGSRGGIFSFFISMLFFFYILNRKKMLNLPTLIATILAISIIGFVSVAVAPANVKNTVLKRLDPTEAETLEDYTAGRLKVWRNGMQLFAEKPVFGFGLRTFTGLMEKKFGIHRAAHNQYLNYLVQFGIIGTILFLLVYYKIFQVMWRNQKFTSDFWEKGLFISYIAGFLGYIISMLSVNMSDPRYIFWFYTAVFLRYGQLRKINQE
jgi:O-antigen ligase